MKSARNQRIAWFPKALGNQVGTLMMQSFNRMSQCRSCHLKFFVALRPFLARQMLWMWAGKVFRTLTNRVTIGELVVSRNPEALGSCQQNWMVKEPYSTWKPVICSCCWRYGKSTIWQLNFCLDHRCVVFSPTRFFFLLKIGTRPTDRSEIDVSRDFHYLKESLWTTTSAKQPTNEREWSSPF